MKILECEKSQVVVNKNTLDEITSRMSGRYFGNTIYCQVIGKDENGLMFSMLNYNTDERQTLIVTPNDTIYFIPGEQSFIKINGENK